MASANAVTFGATAEEEESTVSVTLPGAEMLSDESGESLHQDRPSQHDDEKDDCLCPDCLDKIYGVSELLTKAFLAECNKAESTCAAQSDKERHSEVKVRDVFNICVKGCDKEEELERASGGQDDGAAQRKVQGVIMCPDASDDSDDDSDDTESEECGLLFLPNKYQAKLFMNFSEGILRTLLTQLLSVTACSDRPKPQKPRLFPRGFPKLDNIEIGELIYLMTFYEPAALKLAEFVPDILQSVEILLLQAIPADIREKALSGEGHAANSPMMCEVCINDSEEATTPGKSFVPSEEEYEELCYYSLLLLCIKNTIMTISPDKLPSLLHAQVSLTRSLIGLMHSGLLPTMWVVIMICLYISEMGGEHCGEILKKQGLLTAVERLLIITDSWKKCEFTLCLRKHTELLMKALVQPGSVDFFRQKSREDRFLLRHGHQECLMTETLDDVIDVCPSWPITCSARCWRSEKDGLPLRCERCGFARYCSARCLENHTQRHTKDCFTREDLLVAIQQQSKSTFLPIERTCE